MTYSEIRPKLLIILASTGFIIAMLSAMESHIAWLDAFCGIWGGGCREAAAFSLLGVPIWLWGVLFYAALITAAYLLRPAVFWLVMIGVGVEIGLVQRLISMQLSCFFCILNAVVVLLLTLISLKRTHIWQTLAVGLSAVMVFNILAANAYFRDSREKEASTTDKTIVATVGDKVITTAELEHPLSTQIYNLQQDIFELKHDRLEEMVDDILLHKTAEQKGITVEQLISAIPGIDAKVNDEAVDEFYYQNRSKINWTGTQKDLRLRIREYLQNKQYKQRLSDYARTLRDNFPVTIYLKEPPLPHTQISIGNSYTLGPADAPVTIIEFSDYLCPACRAAHDTSKKIRDRYAGKIRWVFKDYPLERHKGASKLAEAARCAGEQGKFWEFQDRLFALEGRPDLDRLVGLAKDLDLNVDRFSQCFESGRFHDQVEQDIRDARQAGVRSTPTFVIDGKLHPGSLPFDDFAKLIEADIKMDH